MKLVRNTLLIVLISGAYTYAANYSGGHIGSQGYGVIMPTNQAPIPLNQPATASRPLTPSQQPQRCYGESCPRQIPQPVQSSEKQTARTLQDIKRL